MADLADYFPGSGGAMDSLLPSGSRVHHTEFSHRGQRRHDHGGSRPFGVGAGPCSLPYIQCAESNLRGSIVDKLTKVNIVAARIGLARISTPASFSNIANPWGPGLLLSSRL